MEANEKFPDGMKMIADQAHRYGFKAGLWLAPFIAEQKSSIYQNHRDWLLSHDGEQLVEAGVNPGWGGLLKGTYYVLNLDLPEVRAHLKEVFDQVLNVWGYDLVKLDFLFAAALIPAGGKSRGQRMYEAFSFLRECCGDKLILGCGVPLAAAWGQANYCRIGPDIGLNWDMRSAKMIHLRERISTRNAIVNTISRRHFSGRYFANDPDVFILRKKKNNLSPQQKHSLFVINNIFGDLLFTSDNIGSYDDRIMQQYLSSFPLLPKKILRVENEASLYQIWFSIAEREYFVVTNLSREDKKISLGASKFYRNGFGFVQSENDQYLKPFETRVFLQFPKSEFGIAGSTLHLFPGSEVESHTFSGNQLELKLHPKCKTSGELIFKVGSKVDPIIVNGRKYLPEDQNGDAILRLTVKEGQLL
jgi:alpha-galactosidase